MEKATGHNTGSAGCGGAQYIFIEFVASVMIVLNLLYPTLVKRSALMFSCRNIGGRSFFDEVLDVECWKSEHVSAFMTTTLPGAIVFVMGFPLGLLFLLFRLKKRGALKHTDPNYDKRWVLRLGFLSAGYEDEYEQQIRELVRE